MTTPSTTPIRRKPAALPQPNTWGRIGRALKASAARIVGQTVDRVFNLSTAKGGWQAEAWDLYDLVGEQRYIVDTLANTIGRAKLYVGRVSEQDDLGAPEPVDEGDPADVLDLLGTENERSQMLARYGANDRVAGEGYLVGVPRGRLEVREDERVEDPRSRIAPTAEPTEIAVEDLVWRYMSVEEVVIDGDTVKLEWADARAADTNDQIQFTQEEIFLIRVWNSHPRRRRDATSPTRASLPILRELVGLTMHISAQTDSRLAGAGVLFMMQSAQAKVAGESEDEEDVDFNDAFMEAMLTPIRDRASAAAVVPLTVPIPDDGTGRSAADYVHYQTFHTPFDEETRELREEAIRRLALGQDAPPELLLGVGNMNHWGAWLVQADTINTHVEPPLARFCDAATTQFLRPVLEARGIADPEDFVIWYSVQHLISRPNNTADAFTAHEHNVISDEALRTATGFGDEDAPDDTMDPAIAMVLSLVQEAPALAANPGMPALLEQMQMLLAGETGEPIGQPEPEPEPIEDGEEPADGELPATDDEAAPIDDTEEPA